MSTRLILQLHRLRKQWYILFFTVAALLLITAESEEICQHPSSTKVRYFGLPYHNGVLSPSDTIAIAKDLEEQSENQE